MKQGLFVLPLFFVSNHLFLTLGVKFVTVSNCGTVKLFISIPAGCRKVVLESSRASRTLFSRSNLFQKCPARQVLPVCARQGLHPRSPPDFWLFNQPSMFPVAFILPTHYLCLPWRCSPLWTSQQQFCQPRTPQIWSRIGSRCLKVSSLNWQIFDQITQDAFFFSKKSTLKG